MRRTASALTLFAALGAIALGGCVPTHVYNDPGAIALGALPYGGSSSYGFSSYGYPSYGVPRYGYPTYGANGYLWSDIHRDRKRKRDYSRDRDHHDRDDDNDNRRRHRHAGTFAWDSNRAVDDVPPRRRR